MTPDVDPSWAALVAGTPSGWVVGQPYFHDELGTWEMHAYDATEAPVDGKRVREWTAVAPTEEGVVAEMARCLRELAEGRWLR